VLHRGLHRQILSSYAWVCFNLLKLSTNPCDTMCFVEKFSLLSTWMISNNSKVNVKLNILSIYKNAPINIILWWSLLYVFIFLWYSTMPIWAFDMKVIILIKSEDNLMVIVRAFSSKLQIKHDNILRNKDILCWNKINLNLILNN
jgi:hypothetical protein